MVACHHYRVRVSGSCVMRYWNVPLALLLGISSLLPAQDASHNPLRLPKGDALVCDSLTKARRSAADANAAFAFEFSFGTPRPRGDRRTIIVAFDSAGAPLGLRDIDTFTDDEIAGNTQVTIVTFPSGKQAAGYYLRARAPLGNVAKTSQPLTALTEAQVHQARLLAGWLWKRKCGRSST